MYLFSIVGVVTGIVGIVQVVRGAGHLKQAKAISDESKTKYDRAGSQLEKELKNTNEIARKYAEAQVKAYETIERYFDLTTQYPDVTHLNPKVLERLELCRKNPLALNLQPTIQNGLLSAVGEATISTADNLVTMGHYLRLRDWKMSKLENPRKIESLILNSTKGRGILLASAIVGPALMTAGFKLAQAGQQALTEAETYRGQLYVDIEQLKTASGYLHGVNLRLKELVNVVEMMNDKATIVVAEFSGNSSLPEAIKFKQAQLLIDGLLEILTTPVLNQQGKLNAGIALIIEQYKTLNV